MATYLSSDNKTGRVRAFPGEGLDILIWILGSSTESARLAGALGLPYAFASHFAPAQLIPALELYRQGFKPSARLKEPYVMACVNVIAADTDEQARYMATSFFQLAVGIVRRKTRPLQPPVENMEGLWTEYEEAAVRYMMSYSFIGGPDGIKNELENFLQETGVNELMVTSHIYDNQSRLRSYEILAELQKS